MKSIDNNHVKKIQELHSSPTDRGTEEHCGTSQAAKMLGLSVGTIQKLVDQNILQSWKTHGGHRKISITSIQEYQRKFEIIPQQPQTGENRLRVLLVEDDEVTRQLIFEYCSNASTTVECTAMATGMEALINIANIHPDLLITDLNMPGIDGFELLHLLRKNSQFDQMAIMVMTALSQSDIQARGELPPGCIYIAKPAKASWFNGFFQGILLGRNYNNQ